MKYKDHLLEIKKDLNIDRNRIFGRMGYGLKGAVIITAGSLIPILIELDTEPLKQYLNMNVPIYSGIAGFFAPELISILTYPIFKIKEKVQNKKNV